jgi:hypothetical protein
MPFRKDSYGQGHRTPAPRLQVEVPPTPAFPLLEAGRMPAPPVALRTASPPSRLQVVFEGLESLAMLCGRIAGLHHGRNCQGHGAVPVRRA